MKMGVKRADGIDGKTKKNAYWHTPRVSCMRRVPVYESPRWVNDMDLEFMGSAQGVPIEWGCRRWQSMPARDPNSPPQYAHLKPSEMGNCFLQHHQQESLRPPHSGACCDSLNSSPVPDPDRDSQTKSLRLRAKLSTQRRKYAQANAYRWLDQWHGCTLVMAQFQFWMTKKGPSVQVKLEKECEIKLDLIKIRISQIGWKEQAQNTEWQLSLSA